MKRRRHGQAIPSDVIGELFAQLDADRIALERMAKQKVDGALVAAQAAVVKALEVRFNALDNRLAAVESWLNAVPAELFADLAARRRKDPPNL